MSSQFGPTSIAILCAAAAVLATTAHAFPVAVPAPASEASALKCEPEAWAGTWASDYGPIAFTVAGRTVAGVYEGGGHLRGTLDATGCVLDGTWDEPPTRAAPDHAGPFEFTLDAAGGSLDGSWTYDGQNIWIDWKGRRATPAF